MSKVDLQFQIEHAIDRALDIGHRKVEVSGTSSSLVAAALLARAHSPQLLTRAHLVVVANANAAANFEMDMNFWNPKVRVHRLDGYDVDYYSGLYPNSRITAERMGFLWNLSEATGGEVFVASIAGLLQKTLPQEQLLENAFELKAGHDLPSNFAVRLGQLGYQSSPLVEDIGQFSVRGHVVDVFSPAHSMPVRLELFGDTIDSIRSFNPATQRSVSDETPILTIVPARELLFQDELTQTAVERIKTMSANPQSPQTLDVIHSFIHQQYFPGHEFFLPCVYDALESPLDFAKHTTLIWIIDPIEVYRASDKLHAELKAQNQNELEQPRPLATQIFATAETLFESVVQPVVSLSNIELMDSSEATIAPNQIRYLTKRLSFPPQSQPESTLKAIGEFLKQRERVFIATHTESQAQRLKGLLERHELLVDVTIIEQGISESLRIASDKLVFLRDADFFGQKVRKANLKPADEFADHTQVLSFGDLKPGDYVVHQLHGVGQYEGLKVMNVQGVDAEYIQVRYKDDDRLYLPIYRIGQLQKYSSGASERILDRLGGNSWQKATVKVRSHLRDIADELLQLYAVRSQITRPPFRAADADYEKFESLFPYDETKDQLRAVSEILKDMTSERPMDRIVCGDVGFGKTEVAMRAAFKAIEDQRQVAVLAPTTVLTFQHLQTFKKRMSQWPVEIRSLNRFVPSSEVKTTLNELKSGKVDIVIGTHRLLSKDVEFKNLGLLIIDEEHKFGVVHKERIRKLKTAVDTLTLSATPIPRTLNMGFVGLKDLSLINTAPVDRLPTRTFVCQFEGELIRKAVLSEVQRGGQVYFIHNRIHSIYELQDRLRELMPEVRMRTAHGQMDEHELENAMLAFFNHEIDMLVCTAIVESGMDVPRANTMFIDDAHTFGLSQLYQLRGRVGRAKDRAYCYLLVPSHKTLDPVAQERLKVIQENTALGSGLLIAQHDLELRGAGSILGADQSGHINTVGYELYMELLDEALREAKGEVVQEQIEPDINVRIPALIPSDYMPDIRLRLGYYKILSQIRDAADLDRIEEDLRDQFGKPPEPVINLMGLMLIRRYCKDLGVRDLSSGSKTISLAFTPLTLFKPEIIVQLASQENKKYSITPDSRLIIRMNEITWARIIDEMDYLKKFL